MIIMTKRNYVIKKDANGKDVRIILYNKSASAIIPYNGGFVLVKRIGNPFSGYWALAGGKSEVGETPEQTVVREVKEETGLDVEVDFKIKTDMEYGEYLGVKCTYESTCFAVKVIGGVLKRQKDECSDIKIFELDKMLNMNLAFKHNMMLSTYSEMIKPKLMVK